ncbi:MAG: asparagine synthase (glutamine-hydrolyzing) [Acidobacteria bacterium]|nr:asparagine synthase (glutamine-hydrolyzing) [Acidobacteriota bacterium]
MCGIAGVMCWGEPPNPASIGTVERMVASLGHRGPDGRGVAVCAGDLDHRGPGPQVVFGHTRLAILDLSERGAQPMRSADRDVWITFNGEIYNFADLRAELERDGARFQSRTDTEVLLRGYERWGEDVVLRLRGMFAFAIWNGERRTLLVARDRLGIKPLYFHRGDRCLLFASEIRALLASGHVARQLDRTALATFLAYQSVPPPRTLVEGVEMLPPGTLLRVDGAGQVVERQYWDLLDGAVTSPQHDGDVGRARREVRRRLAEAAALHLVSDVPVGVFLSGGIDSSALVALTREAGRVPHTFSVILPGSAEDESRHARVVARRFGAVHEEISLSGQDVRRQIPEALASVDHPSGDGINTFVVARAVRTAGVTVALSGLGGDEVFGGYPSFARMRRLAALGPLWKHSPPPLRRLAAAAVRAIGGESVPSTKAAAVLETDASLPRAFPITRQVFDEATRARLLGRSRPDADDPYVALLEEAASRCRDVEAMSLVSYAECRTYMHDVLLRDADQMSMAHGVEVRVPLLDHPLVEHVVGLPASVKLVAGRSKPLLVDALDGLLPPEITERPKQGFVLPFADWMRTDLRSLCEHHLGRGGLGGREALVAGAIEDVWQRFLARDRSTSWSRPWALVALNAWMEACGIEA